MAFQNVPTHRIQRGVKPVLQEVFLVDLSRAPTEKAVCSV
jgi:hypothetical protein